MYDLLMEVSLSIFMLVSPDKKVCQSQVKSTLYRMLSHPSKHPIFVLTTELIYHSNKKFTVLVFLSFISRKRCPMVESTEKKSFRTLYLDDSFR